MPLDYFTSLHNEDLVVQEPKLIKQPEGYVKTEGHIAANHECDLLISPPMTNAFLTEPPVFQDEVSLLKVNTVSQGIVKRDDDLLTPQQVRQPWPEV